MTKTDKQFAKLRKHMVQNQIIARGIHDNKVLAAMLKVKRHLFVPRELRAKAYEDRPLPIGYGQTISQPYIVAYMTEALKLRGGEKVLEIGTGSGYQAAILAEIVACVYTIEIIPELAKAAKQTLDLLGYRNIWVKCGDGYQGWPEYTPYGAIMVTAAPKSIPEKLVSQLEVGGKMIVPVGSFFQKLVLVEKTKTGTIQKDLLPVRFVPMVKGK